MDPNPYQPPQSQEPGSAPPKPDRVMVGLIVACLIVILWITLVTLLPINAVRE
jgi:hypothetical protein